MKLQNRPSGNNYTRRGFLKAAGSITIGFSLLEGCDEAGKVEEKSADLPGSLARYARIDAWLEIMENSHVKVLTGKMELGQGIRIAIAQVAAEELDLDIENIEVHLAETGQTPNEGYTAGSRSIESSAIAVRFAAAAARQKLFELGAAKLNTRPDQLSMKNGIVKAGDDGPALTFAEIIEGRQIEDEVRLPVPLKSKESYKQVGVPVPRKDISDMVVGTPVYVQDLRFPGMMHARVVHPPSYSATLDSLNKEEVLQLPGVKKLVVDGSFIAVVAEEEYQAILAETYIREDATWVDGPSLPANQPLRMYLASLPVNTQEVFGSREDYIMADDDQIIEANYSKPYIMHASLGPSCSVAIYKNKEFQIWTHSQGVYPLRDALKELLNVKEEAIHIKGVPGSGCYGHNGADDVAAEAALVARRLPGVFVRLQWSREDEHAWEPYGSAMLMNLKAKLDDSGKISYWNYDLYSDDHSTRPGGDPGKLLPAGYLKKPFSFQSGGYSGGAYRNAEPYYTIPDVHIKAHFFKGPLRVSALRSLGAFANIFAIECFMEELAEKVGKEALEFRLQHLTDSRARELILKLMEMTQNESLGANEGMGFGFNRYKNIASYCAIAARVRVDADTGKVQLMKMWGVIDAGETINSDGLKNQTEGGMLQAASWTLMEEVKFDERSITSSGWISYPILRYDNIPDIHVAIIDRPEEKPLGAGEAAQGPAGAAIANAFYNATGVRIRDLPLSSNYKND